MTAWIKTAPTLRQPDQQATLPLRRSHDVVSQLLKVEAGLLAYFIVVAVVGAWPHRDAVDPNARHLFAAHPRLQLGKVLSLEEAREFRGRLLAMQPDRTIADILAHFLAGEQRCAGRGRVV